ncbi:MAG TPA: L,D-transpeptidase [Aestuariivirgaceae bacterium]|jgi:lipoprotein-anchoring transpeptidase ErfK/SrfK
MRRRAFLALVFAGTVLARVDRASATNEFFVPDTPESEPDEQYPISEDDYLLVKPQYRPQIVPYPTEERPGTIVIDTRRRFLYLVLGGGRAKRYGVGVGRRGFQWSGVATVGRKAKWPTWIPPQEMMERDREAAKWPDGMPGGPGNPLGSRALYLYQDGVDTLYRIHGTREPKTIGRAVSSGCVRMLNVDAADLFERAPIGTKVVVIGPVRPVPFFRNGMTKAFQSTFGQRPSDGWKRLQRDLRKLFPKWD